MKGFIAQNSWMLARDFNIILHPSEGSNYNGNPSMTLNSREFVDCVQELTVFDHAYNGPFSTWSNRQGNSFLAKKLDNVMINDIWLLNFSHSIVDFLALDVFDHSSAYIQLDTVPFSPPKPFKFFNFWTKHEKFLLAVADSWKKPIQIGRAHV